MKLYEAMYATACIPFFLKPFLYEDKCFIDGGLINNSPILNCINDICCNNLDSILYLNF